MTVKNKHHDSDYDISADVEKIKAALYEATQDVRGKAGEILSDSIDEVKEQSLKVKNQVVDYTATRPFKSLGFAFLVGMIVGYFFHKS
jgi:ElaB/YqjD/DUF883 family membrane-anchored ribosome-binding protein